VRRVRSQRHCACGVSGGCNQQVQVSGGQQRTGFLRPLGKLQAGAGKDVPEARVFPLLRVVEAVKVKVRNRAHVGLVGFHNRVGGAFDAALHAQRLQQVARKRRLARAQVAMQGDERICQLGLLCQRLRKGLCGGLVGPLQRGRGRAIPRGLRPGLGPGVGAGFYNRQVMIQSAPLHNELLAHTQARARELGFSQIGVSGVDLASAEPGLLAWLAQGFHGDMHYMASHGLKRARPAELVPGTVSVITARMDYLPAATPDDWQTQELQRLQRPGEGIVSLYARGRDYHKVLRSRLQKLADAIAEKTGPLGYRVFTDSAPVLEAELASRSGQGWRGKHSLVLNREAGSMFFLGEIYLDCALPATEPVQAHCGNCTACMDVCPTQAIVAPGQVDARRCISYLTIEHAGPIPLELRPLMGNRIYGCDDCQLVCPWNKFAQRATLPDFDARAGLSGQDLCDLLAWTEAQFLQRTEGGPIRRIGHERWLRNVAVALGNALRVAPDAATCTRFATALQRHMTHDSALVREHVQWALDQTPPE